MVEKGSAVVQLSDYQDLPKPLDFIGIFQDKTVLLAWEYLQLRDIYTSYFIEKSENGRDFKPLGDLPVMNMNDKDGTVKGYDQNGTLRFEGKLEKGKKVGNWTYYDGMGNPIR